MKTLRLGSVLTAVLISFAVIFLGLRATRPAAGLPAALPAPHLGYGLNVWDQPQIAAGLGFNWIKLFEEAGPPPTTTLPYKVLYRVFVDGYPASLSAYLQHIHDLAEAGQGKVHAYEIGNEPNLSGDGFWGNQSVNPEAYAELVCAVSPVIKSVDPQALVISAGLAPVGPWGSEYWGYVMDEMVFAQRLLTRMQAINNGQFCIDGFGYHPHGFAFAPETDYHDAPNGFAFRSAERMHDIMVAAGATHMPMWATEFGWIRHPESDPWTDANGNVSSYSWCGGQSEMSGFLWMLVTEQQQADYLVRAFQYADAHWPWMGPMFVWNLDFFYRGTLCTPQRFYSLFHATDGDPHHLSPTRAHAALAAMPKRLTLAPLLAVQPGLLFFLSEIATPTIQTQTLTLANLAADTTLTWTIAVSPAAEFQPVVGSSLTGTLTSTQSATLTVGVNTSAITTAGAYTAQLLITAEPSDTSGAPIAVPVNVIAVDHLQRTYLPLLSKNYAPPAIAGPGTLQLGLAFVSSAEAPASETRYQRAQAIDGRLNRRPMYWPQIEKNPIGQPRVFDWSRQDANIVADINHGLTVLPILMLTPIGLDTGGSRFAPAPRVGDGLRLQMQDRSASRPAIPSSQGSPPQGLNLSVFSDGSDEPGPGKTINENNRWAYFVNAAVNRYKPGGTLAQQQGWSADQGVRYWEIWNEEDLDQFFIGTPADYARLLKVAYLAARHADPDATIVLGGLAHFEKPNWLSDVLSVIATDPLSNTHHGFMDAVASHNYAWAWQTFGYLYEDRVRLNARGFNAVNLWLTETGVPVCDDPPYLFCPSPYRGTMSEQADFLIQTVAWASWLQTQKIIWFQLYDDAGNDCRYDAFGLVRNPPSGPCTARDGTPRPAYQTFKMAGQYLTNIQPYWRDRRTGTTTDWTSGNQEILAFKRPATGQRVVVMWTRYFTADTVVLTATHSSALLINPDGTNQTITPVNGVYAISLPAATNLGAVTPDGKQPDGTSSIGGSPRILVEIDPAVRP